MAAIVGGVIGFFYGLHHYQVDQKWKRDQLLSDSSRYAKDQEWKRNQFLTDRIREFQSDAQVLNVLKILDYMVIDIPLFPDKPEFDKRFVRVGSKSLQGALVHHTLKEEWNKANLKEGDPQKDSKRFSEKEVAIRDCFDRFFLYLDQFEQNLDSGLYETKYLDGIMKYYADLIATTTYNDEPANAYAAVRQYAADYANQAAKELLERFGCKLPKPTLG